MRKLPKVQENFKCLSPALTPAKVKNLQKILDDEDLIQKRKLLDVLSGEVRLQILYLLATEGNLGVNDLADILKSQVSGISHQLAILRNEKLVKAKRKKKVVFYTLESKLPTLVQNLLS